MRLQLLAAAIEHHWTDTCDSARLLWVLPSANRALRDSVTSPALLRLAERASIPANVGFSIWTYLVGSERFCSVAAESVLEHARTTLADLEPEWAEWMSSAVRRPTMRRTKVGPRSMNLRRRLRTPRWRLLPAEPTVSR